jgi:hypothetical protein
MRDRVGVGDVILTRTVTTGGRDAAHRIGGGRDLQGMWSEESAIESDLPLTGRVRIPTSLILKTAVVYEMTTSSILIPRFEGSGVEAPGRILIP